MLTKTKNRQQLQLLRDEALEQYLNREEFQYDPNADALYQHYKDRYLQLGKNAMEDTMGQAASLTGGYGSSYAQNVGQQAYQDYVQQLSDDVLPALYKLAYNRYQDQGDKLYKTYQTWSQLEQQAAQEEQEAVKTIDYYDVPEPVLPEEPEYDNGKVSEGNIKTMQRVLGLQETGKWTDEDRTAAGERTADDAWLDYQQGKLQSRSKSGMSVDDWTKLKEKQSQSSAATEPKQTAPAVQDFISGMMTKEQADNRGITSKEWEAMVIDRLNRASLTAAEFEALEQHYGLAIEGKTANPTGAEKMSYTEYRKKTAPKKINDFNTDVPLYLNAYQAFVNSAIYDLQNADYHSAQSMLETRIQTAEKLRQWSDALLTSLETSGDIIAGDYSDLLAQISSTQKGIDSVMDFIGNQVKYYSQWDTEEAYNEHLTTQEQLAEDPDKLKREIAQMENMYTIYQDLVTREISKSEEMQLAELRKQYSTPDELKDAIKEKNKYLETVIKVHTHQKQEDDRAGWRVKYQYKSYAELQKIIKNLDAGEERNWLIDYANTKKTQDDWEDELTDAHVELDYLQRLQSERDRLIQFQAMTPDDPGYIELKKQWGAYHNQFDGLDERIEALEQQIWGLERTVGYYDLSQNEDYFEKSQYHGGGDVLQQMVNNPTLAKVAESVDTIGKFSLPVQMISHVIDGLTYDHLQHMTDRERADFNYIYATEGEDAAKDYLEWLQYTLDERVMNNAMDMVSKATQSVPVLSQTVASLISTPLSLMGGIGLIDAAGQRLENKITGNHKPINYNTDAMFFSKASGTIRGTVAQNIADATGVIHLDEETHPFLSRILNGKSFADVYQLGMSMQDSVAVAALTMVNPVLGQAGVTLLGGAAGTQAMLNAVERGATDEQALTIGILSSAFEMLFEKYELDSLLGQGRNYWQAFLRQGLSEAAGEGATELTNILADIAVMAEKSDWDQNVQHYLDANPGWDYRQAEKQAFIDAVLQVGEASLGGWFSGSTMGGGYSQIQNIVNNVQMNKQAYTLYSASQQELVTEALELDPNNVYAQKLQGKLDSNKQLSGAELRKLAAQNETVIRNSDMQNTPTSQNDQVTQKPTAKNIGQLDATVQAANSRVNASVTPEDVTNMLKSKRVDTKTATGITDAIVASLNGQELTKTQSERLSSALDSPTVQSVISELMKKKSNGIDSTLKNAYDEINTIGGNKNGRETALWHLQNQRADGSLLSSQTQTRAEVEDRSGVSGTLREDGSSPNETLSAARRGLISDLEEFSTDDYATVTEGSALHQVQNAFSEEYGIECHIIKDSSWTRSSPAYSRNGVVYIREGIDLGTLSTAVPHEATHVMKQQSFQPYIDFLSQTPDALNFQSATIWRLLGVVSKHKNIDPFDATSQQLLSFYDELNSTVYGMYKSGILNSNKFEYREYIPSAFHDFTSYIQAMDRLHEEFRNQRNASGQTKAADGGVDALMNLANEVTGVSSARMQSTLTSQIDKVNQNANAGNVVQPNSTVQTANNQTNTSMNPAEVAESLKGTGIPAHKIDTLSQAIVARVNGQNLTRTQRDVLRFELGRPSVQRIINDLMQKKVQRVDSVQKHMYDDSNTSNGITNAVLPDLNRPEALSTVQQHKVVSEAETLDGTSIAEDSTLNKGRNALSRRQSRGGKKTKKPYATSRPSYGKGQVEQVWENAKDPITGKVYDPSGVEITWDPTKPRNGQWDMGHMPDAKYSVMHQLYMDDLMSLKDFLEWYRNPDNYRPELPSTNRSHKYE